MNKSIIIIFVIMLASTMVFADEYNYKEEYQKPTVKRFYKGDVHKKTYENNYKKEYQKPTVKRFYKGDVHKKTYENNYKEEYQKPIVKHSYKTNVYKKPVVKRSYKTNIYTPVAKTNIFSLQFSDFSYAEQKRIVAFFHGSAWGASIRKNNFTNSLVVQIKSTWDSHRIFKSLQSDLSLQGIGLNISHTSGYSAFFVPVRQQQYCN